MGGELRVGTSGWHYDHWAGDFYPEGLPRPRWFEHYASRFNTVEINNTFYRLPKPAAFECWRDQAPPNFLYAVKFSRYGTHLRKLLEPADPIARFVEGASKLEHHLGPILVQLPPRWAPNIERLDEFLEAAPKQLSARPLVQAGPSASGEAADASRPRGPSNKQFECAAFKLRWTIEVRDERWLCPELYEVLRRHQAALCIHDLIDEHPMELTADWTYLRFHADRSRPQGSYSPQRLQAEARRISKWLAEGRDVYAYFNNDAFGSAPRNALSLLRFAVSGRRRTG